MEQDIADASATDEVLEKEGVCCTVSVEDEIMRTTWTTGKLAVYVGGGLSLGVLSF